MVGLKGIAALAVGRVVFFHVHDVSVVSVGHAKRKASRLCRCPDGLSGAFLGLGRHPALGGGVTVGPTQGAIVVVPWGDWIDP